MSELAQYYPEITQRYGVQPPKKDDRGPVRGAVPAQPMSYWQAAINQGREEGRRIFYDDPDMQNLRRRREDLSQGYSGQELGALREGSRREIAGQRQGYMGQLRSKLARQGVGGARGAAIQGAADQRFAQTGADAERKMTLDSAQLKRQGVSDLQDYLFRQKYGELGTGMGYGQMAIGEQTANAMRGAAGSGGGGGLLPNIGSIGEAKDAYFDIIQPWRMLDTRGWNPFGG
jgi:hypothetical protein